MLSAELLADIGRTLKVPELLKIISKSDSISCAGKDAGEYKAPPFQFPNDELGIGHRDVRVPDCIPQGTGLEIKCAALARNALTEPNPGLADSICLFGFFCADCGKIPAGFLIFESNIISMPGRTIKYREGKPHNKPLTTRQPAEFYMSAVSHFEKVNKL